MSVADIDVLSMTSLSGAPIFSLSIGKLSFDVVRFSGHEAISALYEFRIEVAAAELDTEQIVGQTATLTIHADHEPRLVHGLIGEAEYVGQTRTTLLYEISLQPWAHRLIHQYDCRIFQDKTTEQIVTEVLTRAGLPRGWFRFSLTEAYAPRNYCVQYRESDLAFVSRLLEEDGIFYFFEHAADRHVWVMADHIGAHPPIVGEPALWFSLPEGLVEGRERVHSFRFGGRVRAGKVLLRDKNLHRPELGMEVEEQAKSGADLSVYDFPGEYQDPGRGGPHQGQRMAKIRLEALQATRRTGCGDSDCPRLLPGATLTLIGHPRHELNGEYRLIEVGHTGQQPQVLDQDAREGSSYHNTFTVTEKKVPYRPPRKTPRPMMRGLQTATVVGPDGEEVHTDEHGRVRVQFHWDRDGKHDESSTCWVRVSQIWAGNGWGTMFLPRIGHEVLLDFLEGDPDRPIVTGRIYHGLNKPPYPLPDEKTKSTIKSDSSLGGGGFNELRFEDKKGSEEVFFHAQRDLNEVVLHDNSRTVTANQTFSVGGNQTFTITGNRSVTVTKGDESLTVSTGKSTTTVKQNRSVTVNDGDSSLTVEKGTHTATVKKGITLTSQTADVDITANKAISVTAKTTSLTAKAKLAVKLESTDATAIVESKQGATVKSGASTLLLSGHAEVTLKSVTKTLSMSSKGAATLKSEATVDIDAPDKVGLDGGKEVAVKADKVSITGNKEITLSVGNSTISIKPDGITVSGPKITSTAVGMHEISGALIKIN